MLEEKDIKMIGEEIGKIIEDNINPQFESVYKQLDKINCPPSLHCDNDDDSGLSYCLYNDSNGILDIDRYQGHGEWDMSPGAMM